MARLRDLTADDCSNLAWGSLAVRPTPQNLSPTNLIRMKSRSIEFLYKQTKQARRTLNKRLEVNLYLFPAQLSERQVEALWYPIRQSSYHKFESAL
jgi:hypothetical protein